MIYASERGHLSILKHLVEHKANIEAKSTLGMFFQIQRPRFCLVCMYFVIMCLRMLICGVDVMLFPGWTPLIQASLNGDLPVVKHLVEHKANIEAKSISGMFLDSFSSSV